MWRKRGAVAGVQDARVARNCCRGPKARVPDVALTVACACRSSNTKMVNTEDDDVMMDYQKLTSLMQCNRSMNLPASGPLPLA